MNKFYLISILLFTLGFVHPGHVIAEVSLDYVAGQVKALLGNRVLSAKTKVIKGRKVHVIKSITADGRIQHHYVDAETGQLIK